MGLQLSSSLSVVGNVTAPSFIGTLQGSASYASTSSYINTASYSNWALTSSFAVSYSYMFVTQSNVESASFASSSLTASYVENSITASYITGSNVNGIVNKSYSASLAETASYILTASYALTASFSNSSSYASSSQLINYTASSNLVSNITDTFTASAAITNIISLSDTEYAGITPNNNTIYFVISAATPTPTPTSTPTPTPTPLPFVSTNIYAQSARVSVAVSFNVYVDGRNQQTVTINPSTACSNRYTVTASAGSTIQLHLNAGAQNSSPKYSANATCTSGGSSMTATQSFSNSLSNVATYFA